MQKKILALIMLSILLLTGCGGDEKVSTIIVEKDGSIRGYIVEEMNASHYDADELKESVTKDIAFYNDKYEEKAMELTKFQYEEGIIKAEIKYKDASFYELYNEEVLFVGKVGEALARDFDGNTVLYKVKGKDKQITLAELGEKNYHVVIFSEPVNVKLPKKVLYLSEGLAKGSSSKKVKITDTTKEIYYIIYE